MASGNDVKNNGRNPVMDGSRSACSKDKSVMKSELAGSWYSADPDQLRRELLGYLENVKEAPLASVCAIVQPHAGYAYSGQTAAYGIRAAQGRSYKRIVVIGPTHRMAMHNVASVANVTRYATPLGEIPVDCAFVAKLMESRFFDFNPMAHHGENSVDLQIPFLQVGLGEFELVVIVVGQLDLDVTEQIAEVIAENIDDDTLVVASGDFTHYGARFDFVPFQNDIKYNLKKMDLGAYEQMSAKSVEGWYEYLNATGATICGRHSIGVLLAMLPDDAQVELLQYMTSGALTGDWANSVSYISAAITGFWKCSRDTAIPEGDHEQTSVGLSNDDKREMLKLARGTLEFYMKNRRIPTLDEVGVKLTPETQMVMGAFVTLHKNGMLRGCIGEIAPRRPLHQAISERVLSAAFEDPRFPQVRAEELGDIEIEISALTPPHSVSSYKDIIVGRHGMVLQKGYRSAVFLPQVAPEQGWDLETTLTHLARKAGLEPHEWQEGCHYEVFEAIVFDEKEFSE